MHCPQATHVLPQKTNCYAEAAFENVKTEKTNKTVTELKGIPSGEVLRALSTGPIDASGI